MLATTPRIVAPTADALGLPPRTAEDTSTLGGGTTCTICFVGTKSHAAVPCGHRFACGQCADVLMQEGQQCPMCRRPYNIETVTIPQLDLLHRLFVSGSELDIQANIMRQHYPVLAVTQKERDIALLHLGPL